MPQFAAGKRESGEHLVAHKKIHDGLDKYDHFLSSSIDDPSVYNGEKLREIMDSFREVLFTYVRQPLSPWIYALTCFLGATGIWMKK